MEIYKKSFIFEVNYFEEYQDGCCVSSGSCNTTIVAKVLNQECIGMMLIGAPIRINEKFGLPILGVQCGDVLNDRIQYGRIPDYMSQYDSDVPVVCNIFNNLTCVRFAMLSPLRIVEFHGKFTNIGNL